MHLIISLPVNMQVVQAEQMVGTRAPAQQPEMVGTRAPAQQPEMVQMMVVGAEQMPVADRIIQPGGGRGDEMPGGMFDKRTDEVVVRYVRHGCNRMFDCHCRGLPTSRRKI